MSSRIRFIFIRTAYIHLSPKDSCIPLSLQSLLILPLFLLTNLLRLGAGVVALGGSGSSSVNW
jgi:hypothetical protein